jgi:hypothetical protein
MLGRTKPSCLERILLLLGSLWSPKLAVLFQIVLSGNSSLIAQQKGQYQPGEYGLNAGVLPGPGITYADFNLNYSAGPPGSFASQTRRSAVQVPSQTEE